MERSSAWRVGTCPGWRGVLKNHEELCVRFLDDKNQLENMR